MTPSENLPDALAPDRTGSSHASGGTAGGHVRTREPADRCLLEFSRAVLSLNSGEANGGKGDQGSILSQVLPNLVRVLGRYDRAALRRLEQELWNWERGAVKLQQFAIANCGESSQRLIDSLNRTRALAETVIESLKQLQPAPSPIPVRQPRTHALESVREAPIPKSLALPERPRVATARANAVRQRAPARTPPSAKPATIEDTADRQPTVRPQSVARPIPAAFPTVFKPIAVVERVKDGQGRWKERRRGPARQLLGWLAGCALTVACVVMLAGWSPSRMFRAPVYVDPDLPQGLKPRAQLFTYAWLHGDLPLMQQLTDPDQESGLVKWYRQNPEPKVPLSGSAGTDLKFQVDVFESESPHTQLKVRVEGIQVAGQPIPPLPQTWEERDSVWTFHPEGTIKADM